MCLAEIVDVAVGVSGLLSEIETGDFIFDLEESGLS